MGKWRARWPAVTGKQRELAPRPVQVNRWCAEWVPRSSDCREHFVFDPSCFREARMKKGRAGKSVGRLTVAFWMSCGDGRSGTTGRPSVT